jgi:hypothetical protein
VEHAAPLVAGCWIGLEGGMNGCWIGLEGGMNGCWIGSGGTGAAVRSGSGGAVGVLVVSEHLGQAHITPRVKSR